MPGTTAEALRNGFDEAARCGGHFCLATHYWEIDARLKSVMDAFLTCAAARPDVRFVAAEQLFT